MDPASAADFPPNDTAPHDGLQLLSPTQIVLDVTGDAPAVGSALILDVSFTPVGPPVPEPSTWVLILLGFAGLGFAGWRRTAAQAGVGPRSTPEGGGASRFQSLISVR